MLDSCMMLAGYANIFFVLLILKNIKMKNYLRVLGVLFSLSILMTSCSEGSEDNNNNEGDGYVAAFSSQFPNATDVTWSSKDGYYIVDFTDAAIDNSAAVTSTVRSSSSTVKQAWYDEDGKCYLEEDFISINDVPTKLVDHLDDWNDMLKEDRLTIDYSSATKGRYKSSIFYKIYYEVSSQHSSEYEIVAMYYYNGDDDFKMIDYWEDVPELDIKTTLPDLYAMKYIEENYDDYCLGILSYYDVDEDELEDYGANESVYYVVLYLPDVKKNLDLVFLDGSSSEVEDDGYYDYDALGDTVVIQN